jgi:hypothetical protein
MLCYCSYVALVRDFVSPTNTPPQYPETQHYVATRAHTHALTSPLALARSLALARDPVIPCYLVTSLARAQSLRARP